MFNEDPSEEKYERKINDLEDYIAILQDENKEMQRFFDELSKPIIKKAIRYIEKSLRHFPLQACQFGDDSKLNVFEEFCVMKQEGSMEDYYFVESTIESCCEAAFDKLTNDEKFILTHQYGFFGKDGSELIMDDFLYYIDNYKSKRIRDSLDRRC